MSIAIQPQHPASATTAVGGSPLEPSTQASLCLSGGGFRATFFHLGVVRFLRDAGLLRGFNHVYGVSGGSILAAHLAQRWDEYSNPEDAAGFDRASAELVEFAQSDLRGRIVRRLALYGWMWPWWTRTGHLEARYARLYRSATLRSLRAGECSFHMLATSLTSGELCEFSADGFTRSGGQTFPATALPVARAVAASSAFPALFPPVHLTRRELKALASEFEHTEYLTDGGVFDNVGVHSAIQAAAGLAANDLNFVVASDASAPFDSRPGIAYTTLAGRATRTTDILMQRVARLENTLSEHNKPRVRWLRIGDILTYEAARTLGLAFEPLDPQVQQALRLVRTDLDVFSFDEIRALAGHGYELAAAVFVQLLPGVAQERVRAIQKIWDPCPPGWPDPERIRLAEHLGRMLTSLSQVNATLQRAGHLTPEPASEDERSAATRRQLEGLRSSDRRRLGLWNPADWTSWGLSLVALAISIWLVATVWRWVRFVL